MTSRLQHYTITLFAEGPIHIGSGKKIGKKEYIFDALQRKVHIPDLIKMNQFLTENGLEKSYEDFMLNDFRDFASWLKSNGVDAQQYRHWVRYSVDSGDAVFEQRGKKEINTFIKDPYGCPYVPGSSLKGAIRTILLANEMLQYPEHFRNDRRNVQQADLQRSRTKVLSKEIAELEIKVFHALNRKEQQRDAVNDILCGLRVGDSEPLQVEDLILCQKIDVTREGSCRHLPILRECIRPETEIRFPLTIDPQYCKFTPQDIFNAAMNFVQFYDKCFLNKFQCNGIIGGGNLYLGGGCGFVSKTILYPLLGPRSVRKVSKIINATLNKESARKHKHDKDEEKGVSPHMLKCTQYDGKLYEMGACSLQIE